MIQSGIQSKWTLFPSAWALARQQLRQVWSLLLLTASGVIVAIVLACAIPLFAFVSMSAGINSVLSASPTSSSLVIHSAVNAITPDALRTFTGDLGNYLQQYMGPYSDATPQIAFIPPAYSITSGDAAQERNHFTSDRLQLVGLDTATLGSHIRLLQGRLPSADGANLEIALTASDAKYLGAGPGSVLVVPVTCQEAGAPSVCLTLTLHVVGVMTQVSPDDPFWRGISFQDMPVRTSSSSGLALPVLASIGQLVHALSSSSSTDQQTLQASLLWYYPLNRARINVNTLDDLNARLENLANDEMQSLNSPVYVTSAGLRPYFSQLTLQSPLHDLAVYSDHIAVVLVPIVVLALLIMGLLLLFQSSMSDLLVERQAGVIALLMSRGSSRAQIFGAFVVQIALILLLSLFASIFLTVPLVRLLVEHMLSAGDQQTLTLLAGNPLLPVLSVWWAVLAMLIASLVTMIVAVQRATRVDMLTLRREAARTARRPFWIRFHLDFILVVLALLAYSFAIYMQNTPILDPASRILLESPLALMGIIFFLIGCSLILLRFIPNLLNLGGRLVGRTRRIGPMLALAQMARAPRQTLRMTLLLTFATAFIMFVLIFNASQAQHIQDIATYQVGADFSGSLSSVGGAFARMNLAQQTALFRQIGGVTAAALGSSSYFQVSGASDQTSTDVLHLLAVDPVTFGQATLWSDAASRQTMLDAEQRLISQRQVLQAALSRAPASSHVPPLPALVDHATWQALRLAPGRVFSLKSVLGGNTTVTSFVALAQVAHLPTVNDLVQIGDKKEIGILVDYQSASVFNEINTYNAQLGAGSPLSVNAVWLRALSDANALAHVRAVLTMHPPASISPLYDRALLVAQGEHDPLYLVILGVLSLGALVPVLLALVSNLVASWMSVYGRLTNFAMLRALGCSPRQLVSILAWEQGIIYSWALGLGLLSGLLLAVLALPALVFTGGGQGLTTGANTQNVNFYALQNLLPIHMVVPVSLLLALGVLIITCILALILMVRTVARPALSQTLRLNQD